MTVQFRGECPVSNPVYTPNTAPNAGLTVPNTVLTAQPSYTCQALTDTAGVSTGCAPAPASCGGSLDISA